MCVHQHKQSPLIFYSFVLDLRIQHIQVNRCEPARFCAGEMFLKAGEISSNCVSKCFKIMFQNVSNIMACLQCHLKKNIPKIVSRCF